MMIVVLSSVPELFDRVFRGLKVRWVRRNSMRFLPVHYWRPWISHQSARKEHIRHQLDSSWVDTPKVAACCRTARFWPGTAGKRLRPLQPGSEFYSVEFDLGWNCVPAQLPLAVSIRRCSRPAWSVDICGFASCIRSDHDSAG